MEIIGERNLEIALPGEAGDKTIRVLLGKPEEKSEGAWIAPYEIHGPDAGEVLRHVAYGGDALQALGCRT